MSLPAVLQHLRIPVIGAPMFIAGNPQLVIEQRKAGFDPLNLPKSDPGRMNFGSAGGAENKVWRDIWSAGQGVGQIDAVLPVAQVVDRLAAEYVAARQRLQIN